MQLSNLPLLITGGAGFIGSHLTRALLDAGAHVTVLDNLSSGSRSNLPAHPHLTLIQGDLRDDAALAAAVKNQHIIFHLAALGSVPASLEAPLLYHEVNATGTLRLLQAARHAGVRRIVYSASSSAYGDTPILPKTESMRPDPKSPYAASKLAAEHYLRVYAGCYGLQTVSLRYFNVFGPRQNPRSQYAAVIPAFIASLQNGQPPTIYGDGEQTRDFCHVSNVVHANLLAATTQLALAGQVYNVACAQSTTLNALLAEIQSLLHTSIPATHAPARTGDVRDSLADIAAITRDLGYTPKTLLAPGIAQTVHWFQNPR